MPKAIGFQIPSKTDYITVLLMVVFVAVQVSYLQWNNNDTGVYLGGGGGGGGKGWGVLINIHFMKSQGE